MADQPSSFSPPPNPVLEKMRSRAKGEPTVIPIHSTSGQPSECEGCFSAVLDQFAKSFDKSAKRWELIVYPSLFAFIVLAMYGFFLIYSLTQDIRTMAVSIDPKMGINMGSLSTSIQHVADNVEMMSTHLEYISDNMETMSVDMRTISDNIDSMNNTVAEMSKSVGELNKSVDGMSTKLNNLAPMTNNTSIMAQAMQVMTSNISVMGRDMNSATRPMSFINRFMPW